MRITVTIEATEVYGGAVTGCANVAYQNDRGVFAKYFKAQGVETVKLALEQQWGPLSWSATPTGVIAEIGVIGRAA